MFNQCLMQSSQLIILADPKPCRHALEGDPNYPIVMCFPFLLASSLVALGGEKLAFHLLRQVGRSAAVSRHT